MVRLRQQFNIRPNWLAKLSGWVLVLALIALIIPTIASAAFSPYVNYQGKLTNSSGTAVADGSYNLKFRLCQDSACASSLWSETYEGSDKVAISSGLFSVMLGQLTSLSDIDFNQTLYLEVQVGGSGAPSYETLLPRKILGAVPNAFNARKFDGLATTSFLRSDLANASATINNLISVNSTSTNSTSSNSTYLGAIAGLNGVYISNWSDLASSGFSTTSADYWFSTKSVSGFTTTSADYWLSTQPLGYFWSTTSADVWGLSKGYITTDVQFSTTSADYWDTTKNRWTSANATTSFNSLIIPYSTQAYNSSTFLSLVDWFATSTQYLTTTTAASTYLTQADWFATTTDGLAEGLINKYYTQTRVWDDIIASTTLQSYANYWTKSGTDLYYNTGNVGIGTTSPSYKLDILSETNYDKIRLNAPFGSRLRLDATNNTSYYTEISNNYQWSHPFSIVNGVMGTDILGLYSSGATQNTALMTGNVGIGTTTPSTALHVYNGSASSIATIQNTTAGGDFLNMIGDAGNSVFVFESGGTGGEAVMKMYTDNVLTNQISARSAEYTYFNGGNVGIGTTTPGKKLEVYDSDPIIRLGDSRNLATTAWAGTEIAGLEFNTNDPSTASTKVAAAIRAIGSTDSTGGAVGGDLSFLTSGYLSATPSEIMRITGGGNVGIGTTTPSTNLQIYGNNAELTLTGGSSGNNYITVDSPYSAGVVIDRGVATNPSVVLHKTAGSNTWVSGIPYNSGSSESGYSISYGSWNKSDSKFYIDTTGNVGIGTTTPAAKLQVHSAVGNTSDLFVISSSSASGAVSNLLKIERSGQTTLTGTHSGLFSGLLNIIPSNSSNSTGISIVNSNLGYSDLNVNGNNTSFQSYSFGDNAKSFYAYNLGADSYAFYGESGYGYFGNSVGIGKLIPDNAVSLDVEGTVSSTALQVNGNAIIGTGAAGDSFIDFSIANVAKFKVGVDDSDGDSFVIATGTALGTGNKLRIDGTTGNITINSATGSSTSKFVVYNTASIWGGVNRSTGAWMNSSDAKLKTDVSDLENPLQKILGLRPVRYNWVSDSHVATAGQHIGFIAQEVETVLPELVTADNSGLKSLSYAEFSPVIVGAIQQQQAEIDLLKAQLSSSTPVSSGSPPQTTIIVNQASNHFDDLAVSSAATFYGTITVIGEAGFESKAVFKEDVEIKGKLYVDQDQAGTALIVAGATSTRIAFSRPYQSIPKVVANLNASVSTIFARYAVADKSTSSFLIILDSPASQDISFDWIALGLREIEGQVAGAAETAIPGCTDPIANNFQLSATSDDGSCQYDAPAGDSTGSGSVSGEPPASGETASSTSSLSGDSEIDAEIGAGDSGAPDVSNVSGIISGCTNQTAANYNPLATSDDGSCELPAAVIESNQETAPIGIDPSAS